MLREHEMVVLRGGVERAHKMVVLRSGVLLLGSSKKCGGVERARSMRGKKCVDEQMGGGGRVDARRRGRRGNGG